MENLLSYEAYGQEYKAPDMETANRNFLWKIPQFIEYSHGAWFDRYNAKGQLIGYRWCEGNLFD